MVKNVGAMGPFWVSVSLNSFNEASTARSNLCVDQELLTTCNFKIVCKPEISVYILLLGLGLSCMHNLQVFLHFLCEMTPIKLHIGLKTAHASSS